jgi:hypothetical protein
MVMSTDLSCLCDPFPEFLALSIPSLCTMFHRSRHPYYQPV